ncbi:MAG TPA: carbon starvation protein A [Paludibacter sp.]|nr:carbon starvation protein A [Paludibacter sp.]
MTSFIISIAALILGYMVYGKIAERIFGASKDRPTPAISNPDGVDYVPLAWWRVFLIQFLNIAGLGPIFGAIMGIMFGQAAFLWIVLGTIFAGGVHDYFSGMMSIRRNGASLPELVGQELGLPVKQFMRVFSLVLMVLVGAVFVSGPASLLANLTPGIVSATWWAVIVFIYYMLATLLPIDKLIGRIYPVFGFALLFMATGIFIALIVNKAPIPEFTTGFKNLHPQNLPIFPMMFVSIACGAISGFHATQSPMMARCMKNEMLGRRIFYGSMVAEGILALIWAAAASSFFGSIQGLQDYVAGLAPTANKPAIIVDLISKSWLGHAGGILALLGVVAAPLTSGDTALRSARLIAADFLKLDQKPVRKRLMVSIPIFMLTLLVLQTNFDILWRYFAWCNQSLAVFTLWAITVYLAKQQKFYWITLVPAIFMTAVSMSYILVAPEGFHLPISSAYLVAGSVVLAMLFVFWHKTLKINR